MRQTRFLAGIIETLPELIGDGDSNFSVQSSMLENFERVCKALLGNSSQGRVMAGMVASVSTTTLTIASGYGITKSGKMIVLANAASKSFQTQAVANATIRVYIKYVKVDRGTTADTDWKAGGRTSWINKEANQLAIIQDSLGANAADGNIGNDVIEFDAADASDMLYIGQIQVNANADGSAFIAVTNADESVEYKSTPQIRTPLFTTTGISTTLEEDSLVLTPRGRKRLKQINFIYPAMTSGSPRSGDHSLRIQPVGRNINGGTAYIGNVLQLDDVNARTYVSKDVGVIVGDDIIGIYLHGAVTGNTFTAPANQTTVEYIIEKLN